MLWYLFGFAVGAGVLGGVWWLLRKLDVRFTWRGTEWMAGLLLAALLTGCASAPDENAPVGAAPRGRPDVAPRGRPDVAPNDDGQARGPAPTGSVANPVYLRCAALETLAAIAAKDAAGRAAFAAPSVPSVPSVLSTPAKPSGSLWGAYFWRRAGFDLGVACGAGAFAAAWWFFLKRAV